MTLQRYDFAQPNRLAGGLEKALAEWLRGTCARAPARWGRHFPFRVEISARGPDVLHRDEALARLPENVIAHHVALSGGLNGLLALSRPLVLTLVGGLLGDGEGRLSPDREMTPVEESLYEFILQELFLPSLREAWTGEVEERVELREREWHPKWTRVLPLEEDVVVGTFCFRGAFGEQQGYWLLPRKSLLAQLTPSTSEDAANRNRDLRPILEAHVREARIPVTIVLGEAKLPLSELAALQPGDVVILNQRIDDTLPASVAGKRKFRVWCGRVGTRQAFQVESLTES